MFPYIFYYYSKIINISRNIYTVDPDQVTNQALMYLTL